MKKTILSLVALVVFSAGALDAQSPALDNRTATASITIPTLLHIDVSNLTVDFPNPSFDDFDAGFVDATTDPSQIDTRGNVLHDVQIAADFASFTGPYAKPAGDLRWSIDGGTSWTDLTTSTTDVATAVSRGANTNVATVNYRMRLNATDDIPGDYSLDFTYTVVAN